MTNHCRTLFRWLLPTVLLCGFGFMGAIAGDTPAAPAAETLPSIAADAVRGIEISHGDPVLLEYPDWLTTVKSVDPGVLRIEAVRPNCLRLQSLNPGITTLKAVDRQDRSYSVRITVLAETR